MEKQSKQYQLIKRTMYQVNHRGKDILLHVQYALHVFSELR